MNSKNDILELTGNQNWSDIEDWFNDKTLTEIEEELNRVWPNDDNAGLAISIYNFLD